MFHFRGPGRAVIIALGAALSANAQPAASPATGGSAAAGSPGASEARELPYRSTLDGYQPFTDEKIRSWREANDNVGRIGGWRAYAREVQGGSASPQGDPAPAAPAAAPQRAAPGGQDLRSGHGKH